MRDRDRQPAGMEADKKIRSGKNAVHVHGSEKLQNVDGKYIFALQNVDLRYFILKKATDYMVT